MNSKWCDIGSCKRFPSTQSAKENSAWPGSQFSSGCSRVPSTNFSNTFQIPQFVVSEAPPPRHSALGLCGKTPEPNLSRPSLMRKTLGVVSIIGWLGMENQWKIPKQEPKLNGWSLGVPWIGNLHVRKMIRFWGTGISGKAIYRTWERLKNLKE